MQRTLQSPDLLYLYTGPAAVFRVRVYGDSSHRDWLDDLRRIVGHPDARSVGRRDIGDVEAAGWQVTDEGWQVTVWADAATAELLQVELARDESTLVFTDFRYNVDIEASQFEPQAPAGYQVQPVTIDAAVAGETDVITLLRIWAMGNHSSATARTVIPTIPHGFHPECSVNIAQCDR